MSTFEVKMVTVTIEPHDNADALEVAKINKTDYVSVVPKDKFKTGDEALYIPDQAIVPDWILEELNLVGKLAGSKRNRIKPMNLRGVLSQGILYKPSDLAWAKAIDVALDRFDEMDPFEDGQALKDWIRLHLDWAPALGIEKWVPEVPLDMAGVQYAPDAILPYTEIDDIKKYPNVIQEGEDVVITEKIHGTCAIYHYANGKLHVSSKGVAKKGLAIEPDENNLYWKVAKNYGLEYKLQHLAATINADVITLFGEIYGVQDLKYGKTKNDPGFRAFDIAVAGKFVGFDDFEAYLYKMKVNSVPIIYTGGFYYNHLKDFAAGGELVTLFDDETKDISGPAKHIREGVVIKPRVERKDNKGNRVIYKYVSPDYLNRKGDTTEYE